ncbi:MAG: DUF4232 domain-containing protein, partial [Candidatus Limnocylindrales bacterium]
PKPRHGTFLIRYGRDYCGDAVRTDPRCIPEWQLVARLDPVPPLTNQRTATHQPSGSVPPTPSSSTSPAPAQIASPSPLAIPPLDQTCVAADLAGRFWTTGAGGAQAGGITLWSRGTAACWLDGYPTLSVAGSDGKVLAITYVAYPGPATDAGALSPALLLADLGAPSETQPNAGPFGQTAGISLDWSNWCGAPIRGTRIVSLSLPHEGGTLRIDATMESPRCDAPNQPSTMGLSRLEMVTPPPPGTVLPSPTLVPSAGRSCMAADLGLRFDPYEPNPGAVGGGHGVDLTVWDRGSTACDLQGVPDVSFVDASGRTFSPTVTPDGSPVSLITLLPGLGEPSLSTAGVAGSAARTNVLWQPDCGTRIAGSTVTAVLHLGSGTLKVRVPAPEPICPSPSPGYLEQLIVSSWAPGWLP